PWAQPMAGRPMSAARGPTAGCRCREPGVPPAAYELRRPRPAAGIRGCVPAGRPLRLPGRAAGGGRRLPQLPGRPRGSFPKVLTSRRGPGQHQTPEEVFFMINRRAFGRVRAFVSASLALTALRAWGAEPPRADLVLDNAVVYTLNARQPKAEAVAIAGH